MKKICVVTAARSEYGLLKWVMTDIEKSEKFILQVIVTGAHLSKEQGYTVEQITEDGFKIDYKADVKLDTSSKVKIAESMGRMALEFANAYELLKPDYVLVLGDRYEMLPICNTAFVMGIPIIHLSGGDITEGAIDDGIRNAVTMLATYHFPGNRESAERVAAMRDTKMNVWAVGEPGLDSLFREELMDRSELADSLGLDVNRRWALMTYHPETRADLEVNLSAVENCINAILKRNKEQLVITYANADFGGKEINEYIEKRAKDEPVRIKVVASLGHRRYLSFMKQVEYVIGNSSSGIVEAPIIGIPAINIGNRQKGRYQCGNVIQCASDYSSIETALDKASAGVASADDATYWGEGNTSRKIVEILESVIC